MAGDQADLILSGGPIFQGLKTGFCDALAIKDGKVLAGGTDGALESLQGPDTKVFDLAGRAAIPGINDGHQHLLSFGLEQNEIVLHPTRVSTLTELTDAIAERARQTPPGQWILGRRYDHYHLAGGQHPTRYDLDRATGDHPVYITRTCGHMGVANSKALEICGITRDSPNPQGGEIVKENGEPTGLLHETAQALVKSHLPAYSVDELVAGIEAAGRTFLAHGITSVMDAGLGLRQDFDDYRGYKTAYETGRLPLRVYLALCGGPNGIQQQAHEAGLMTGGGDERFKIGPVKLFTDGSAGGKTAAMTLPYICACDNRGLFVYEDQDLDHWVELYHRQGYQVALHAIGDAAIDQALNAVEGAVGEGGGQGRRHRIEHCGFTRPDQIERMQRLDMIPAPQPIFLYEFGELYVDVLGAERPASSYPMRSWEKAGLGPIASSDTPVSDFSPMKNLYCMVTRKTDRGRVLGAAESLSLEEAISAATLNGARGGFSETVKGTLEPGMLADIAICERDIFAHPPEALLETRIDATILGGEVVYERA